MQVLEITLAGPPRGKGRPRFANRGAFVSTYTDAKTRKYEDDLRKAAVAAMVGRAPLDEPLTVAVEAHMPIPGSWSRPKRLRALAGELMPTGRPDADNLIKCTDALNKIVWRDDALIVSLQFIKLYSEQPRLLIKVQPWND